MVLGARDGSLLGLGISLLGVPFMMLYIFFPLIFSVIVPHFTA